VLGEQLLEVLLDAVLLQAGSTPSSWLESCWTSSKRIRSVSSSFARGPSLDPALVGALAHVQGGDIQLSGLYEPPSEWTSTDRPP
jgi:hypothetical protein